MSKDHGRLDRVLVLEVARVTEASAVAAARYRGRGNEMAADAAAVEAMHRELAKVAVRGTVIIGEGDEGEVEHLFVGEAVGSGEGPEVDIAVDPLEGTNICAKGMPSALSVLAITARGGMLRTPIMYMNKIAVGPGFPEGVVDLDATPADNVRSLAKAKGVPVGEIMACILDRPRHAELIRAVREAGAGVRLIPDGDVASVIWTTRSVETGVDIYMGLGGAREGVIAAAALRCIGGQMQGRLMPMNQDEKSAMSRAGISDRARKYALTDMVAGDVIFAATGVTSGSLLAGVRFNGDMVETETMVLRSETGTARRMKTTFRDLTPKAPTS